MSVTAASLGTFQDSIDVVGTLLPKYSADVKSEVTATVVEVYVTEWVPVRKGARLARFDTSEIEATVAAPKAVVEAGTRMGWEKYAGPHALYITIETFGLSAPAQKLAEHFGFTKENIVIR